MSYEDQQIQQTIELMNGMCRALTALSTGVLPVNRQKFALLAEGPLEDLRRLHEEVNRYIDETLQEYHEMESADSQTIRAA